jgi:hypothetical protein
MWTIGLAAALVLVGTLDRAHLFLVSTVWAKNSDATGLNWQVMSAGGAPAASNSGHINMNGTLGQTAIGTSSIGQTSILAGFWHSLKQAVLDLFMPLIQRGN